MFGHILCWYVVIFTYIGLKNRPTSAWEIHGEVTALAPCLTRHAEVEEFEPVFEGKPLTDQEISLKSCGKPIQFWSTYLSMSQFLLALQAFWNQPSFVPNVHTINPAPDQSMCKTYDQRI